MPQLNGYAFFHDRKQLVLSIDSHQTPIADARDQYTLLGRNKKYRLGLRRIYRWWFSSMFTSFPNRYRRIL